MSGSVARYLAAVIAFAGSLLAQPTAPAPGDLIARAIAARKAQEERGRKFTYREDHTQFQLDKDGKVGPPSTKTYEHIMLEGDEYRKLILVEGKPLDAKAQKKVDEDLEKARRERRTHPRLSLNRTVSLGGPDLLGKLFINKVTGEDDVMGRATWRMESEPKSDYKPADKQEDEALASRRVTWFDEADGAIVKESNTFIRSANGFQPGSIVDCEYTKVGDDSLPGEFVIRADVKLMAVAHARVESRQHYYDYRRFTVDSTVKPQ